MLFFTKYGKQRNDKLTLRPASLLCRFIRILELVKSCLSRTLASRKLFEKLFPNCMLSLQPDQRQFCFGFLFSFVFNERSHEQLLSSPDVQSLVTECETDAAAMA